MSLVQLVPTAGGSLLARWMRNPIFGRLTAFACKRSAAENPSSHFAETCCEGEGNKKFWAVIRPERTYTILLQGDPHSLALVKNKKVQQRYVNGIGTNVVVIPKHSDVTHEYLPTHPVALGFLSAALESLRNGGTRVQARSLPPKVGQRGHLAQYPPDLKKASRNAD